MSQKTIIILILGIAAAAIGFWWLQGNTEEGATQVADTTPQATEAESESTTVVSEYAARLERGESIECTFSGTDPDTDAPVSGTVIASGERFAVETNTAIEGSPVTVQLIQTDPVLYVWSDQSETVPAVAFDPSSFPNAESMVPATPDEWFDEPDVDMSYECQSTQVTAETFTPPTDIDFMDPFASMEGIMESLGEQTPAN